MPSADLGVWARRLYVAYVMLEMLWVWCCEVVATVSAGDKPASVQREGARPQRGPGSTRHVFVDFVCVSELVEGKRASGSAPSFWGGFAASVSAGHLNGGQPQAEPFAHDAF
ncbi:hypothetical protein BDV95DRAFT_217588 [Massariosphaeria phaeospora]|uniref:Uncharacterized protein n=1 Tax=Massariosphaeria phaeospora TaxID=100035 RepID=A0A7C8IGJ1_9PLEO|nr:hypothetical protein BDV95DRAFT_217588 [Massariosphaeria phaeospora]